MAKWWTRIGMIILIIACLVNIVFKLTTRINISGEIAASAEYVKDIIHIHEQQETKK